MAITNDMLRFSLILCTISRRDELSRFLTSIVAQRNLVHEIIVVDQNPKGHIDDILTEFKAILPLHHVYSKPGLSRARNVGLRLCKGEIVAFPDDDCWYPQDLLNRIRSLFVEHPDWDGLSTLVVDTQRRFSAGGFMASRTMRITKRNVWRTAVSPSLFFLRRVIERVGFFDESLGRGGDEPLGSGEETDYLLYTIACGLQIQYVPECVVIHPRQDGNYSTKQIQRGYEYGLGMGHVLRRHGYSILSPFYYAGLQVLRAAQSLAMGRLSKMRFHSAMALGRWQGWWSSVRTKKASQD